MHAFTFEGSLLYDDTSWSSACVSPSVSMMLGIYQENARTKLFDTKSFIDLTSLINFESHAFKKFKLPKDLFSIFVNVLHIT